MADRWQVRETEDGAEVWRNGRWYDDFADLDEALAFVDGRRAKQVTVVDIDGVRRTQRPR